MPAYEVAYLGKAYSDSDIESALGKFPSLRVEKYENIHKITAKLIAQNYLIGWFQGRSEFGPRALGNRSILANPCCKDMKEILNRRVKFREEFRPFAPIIAESRLNYYFDNYCSSPYMLKVFPVKPGIEKVIPAVVHVDGTSRLQSISEMDNPLLFKLLLSLEQVLGVACVLNTSFNVRGEPIVESPDDALNCFTKTNLDFLIMHNYCISKKEACDDRLSTNSTN